MSNTDHIKLLKLLKEDKIEILNTLPFSTLKCGKYTITISESGINHAILEMLMILSTKYNYLGHYANFIQRSLRNETYSDLKLFSYDEFVNAKVYFIEKPTGVAFPFDNLDYSIQLVVMSYYYNSFDDIKLSDYEYIYTISDGYNTSGESKIVVRGVTKNDYALLVEQHKNATKFCTIN